MKNKIGNINGVVLIGILLVGAATAFASCFHIWQYGSCPNFSPTSSGSCPSDCNSYYEYTPVPVYTGIDLPNGLLAGCSNYSFAVSYTFHQSFDNCGSLTPQCLYHAPQPKETQCSTISCEDYCYGG